MTKEKKIKRCPICGCTEHMAVLHIGVTMLRMTKENVNKEKSEEKNISNES